MINDQIQKQDSGDGCINLQTQNLTVNNNGLSYTDIKEIVLDLFRDNFIKLSAEASEIASTRVEQITEEFFKKLLDEDSELIQSLRTPAMQASLYEAQKQYAITGDENLKDLLLDILVDRTSTEERSMHQIVLNEAIQVAPKLIPEQMDALTVNFLLTRTFKTGLTSIDSMFKYIMDELMPFIQKLSDDRSCYDHLQYAGCASVNSFSRAKSIEQLFLERYGGLFSKGFTLDKLNKAIQNHDLYQFLIVTCLHDPNFLQINAVNEEVIKQFCEERNLSDHIEKSFIGLYRKSLMPTAEIKKYLISEVPEIESFMEVWNKSNLSQMSLTTVGIAIAQANFRRKTGVELNLATWVK